MLTEKEKAERRRYYAENREKVLAQNKKRRRVRRAERRAEVALLKTGPCSDCGGVFPPECMDFDHLSDKLFSIAHGVNYGFNKERLAAEIKKCELVCANCHRIRTADRRREA